MFKYYFFCFCFNFLPPQPPLPPSKPAACTQLILLLFSCYLNSKQGLARSSVKCQQKHRLKAMDAPWQICTPRELTLLSERLFHMKSKTPHYSLSHMTHIIHHSVSICEPSVKNMSSKDVTKRPLETDNLLTGNNRWNETHFFSPLFCFVFFFLSPRDQLICSSQPLFGFVHYYSNCWITTHIVKWRLHCISSCFLLQRYMLLHYFYLSHHDLR